MDPEQTFIRVQERFTEMLTPRIRATLEYFHLFLAVTLFCVLVVMHANYVQQPGCSSQLSEIESSDAQLVQIKITSSAAWSENDNKYGEVQVPDKRTHDEPQQDANADEARSVNSAYNFLINKFEILESQADVTDSKDTVAMADVTILKSNKDSLRNRFFVSPKESIKAASVLLGRKWHRRICFLLRLTSRILGDLWEIAGIHLHLDVPKWLKILHLDEVNSYAVQWLGQRSKFLEPTYLYTIEKGYFLLSEEARLRHNIHTININISAWNPCFGNRWQQLLINRLVGYDTILMNSLLNSPGQGYLFNYQTKEFYNLTYAHKQPESSADFGDYLVTKCGVLMMSLFVFFTTTMSVSFTLRETQARMLKFTVQLQHHARHRLPTFQLIFVHVIESLVFVPIMIGILFFLFEFYDDQLLAFMVLILVWLCELFTLISVRTPLSMKFFPRFFLLYFLVFHIYFFSYAHGFSYLALSTTAAFMQHLILYFWNRFEVPALQRFVQSRRSHFQQHPDFHITSSTILASTLHIRRLNTRNQAPDSVDLGSGPGVRAGVNPSVPVNSSTSSSGVQEGAVDGQQQARLGNPLQLGGRTDHQSETVANPGSINSFSSLLLWILGGASSASSEGLNSFLSIFRDLRDHDQELAGSPGQENNREAIPND